MGIEVEGSSDKYGGEVGGNDVDEIGGFDGGDGDGGDDGGDVMVMMMVM